MYYIIDIESKRVLLAPKDCTEEEDVIEYANTLRIRYALLKIEHLNVSRIVLMDGTSVTIGGGE